MSLSQTLQKLTDVGLLTLLAHRQLLQPISPQFRMDLHYAYHQGLGHETNHCTTLRHAIQDLIDQGLVHLGQPSVTTNPLLAHTSHVVTPLADGIHFMSFIESDDRIHMLSWDDSEPEPIVAYESYEVDGVISNPQASTPFRLVPDTPPVQLTTVGLLICPCYSIQSPFILTRDPNETVTQDVQYVIRGGRVVRQQPPTVTRPLESDTNRKEINPNHNLVDTHLSLNTLM